jgi:integral membrane sensor domain MASE1
LATKLTRNTLWKITLDRRYWLTVVVVTVVYALAAKLGLALAFSTQQVTTVWPPSGIALVAILWLGYKYWPGIFVGAFVANLLTHEQVWVAAAIAAGNTLEALVAVYLLKRLGFKKTFSLPREVFIYAFACMVSVLIAASLGPVWLALGGLIDWGRYFVVAGTWWQGDLLGDLVFGTFLLAFLNRRAFAIIRGRYIEGGLLLAITFAASVLVFTSLPTSILSFPYLLFPLVIWAAIRFTQVGVVVTTMLMTITAVWATVSGSGPFTRDGNVEHALIQLQVYIFVLSATAMVMAMAITERLAAESALQKQGEKLAQVELELREANKRVTNILAEVLDGDVKRNGNGHDEKH